MYKRDHKNCWNCNGWILRMDVLYGRKGMRTWIRNGPKTVGMVCEVCGHDYMEGDDGNTISSSRGSS